MRMKKWISIKPEGYGTITVTHPVTDHPGCQQRWRIRTGKPGAGINGA